MYTYTGKYCVLEELTSQNDKLLFQLLTTHKNEYKKRVHPQEIPSSYEAFQKTINGWFNNGREYQFIIFKRYERVLIGTGFFYNQTKHSIKLSVFYTPESRAKIGVADSIRALLLFAFNEMKVEKVIISVYSDNVPMIRIAKKLRLEHVPSADENISDQRSRFNFQFTRETLQIFDKHRCGGKT